MIKHMDVYMDGWVYRCMNEQMKGLAKHERFSYNKQANE